MVQTRYLRLDPGELYHLKKQIKFSEETFSNILRGIKTYRFLRKKETALKNRFRMELSSFKSKLSLIESGFPEEERKTISEYTLKKENQSLKKGSNKIMIRPTHPSEEKKKTIDQELEDIKAKLSRFG